jgi:hypothetical protein
MEMQKQQPDLKTKRQPPNDISADRDNAVKLLRHSGTEGPELLVCETGICNLLSRSTKLQQLV